MKLRAAAAVLGSLVLAACQGPSAATPTPRLSAAASALAAADTKLFNGDYEGAESAYRTAMAAGTPGAGAHLALLLDYESRFREAIASALADVDKQPSSGSLARLTRAYDWASDVPAALDTGLRAVKASPVDPLAHVFYAEALSDAGRFAEAESQLRTVEGQGSDAYLRSEIYREWANYYRDRGDAQSELNNMELSQKEQPHFPERALELVRYYYVAKKPDLARSGLDQGLRSVTSGAVLAAGGDSAFMAGDFDTASSLYQSAATAAPSSPEPVAAQAVISIAAKRDIKGAHDQLLAALRKNPADGTLYEFLWNLDRYILKTDPAAELNPIAPQGADPLRSSRGDALAAVNAVRQTAGVSATAADPALDTAAEEHAWYTIFNLGQASLSGLGVHTEDASLPGFLGASSIARDRAAGYPGTRGAEVINHVATPEAAVGVWVHSVYHRFPLLDPESQAVGYGEAVIGPLAVAVMDIGQAEAKIPAPVIFPADGQKNVPTAFTGNEVPDPAPQGTEYPVGYPVTLQVGTPSGLAVSSGKLTGPDGKELAAWILEPNKQVDSSDWCLLPQRPLKPGTTYTVEVSGTVDGQAFSKRWSFTTSPAA